MTRTVVVDSESDVVRVGKGVVGEAYLFRNNQWVKVKKLHYPESWYAGPLNPK